MFRGRLTNLLTSTSALRFRASPWRCQSQHITEHSDAISVFFYDWTPPFPDLVSAHKTTQNEQLATLNFSGFSNQELVSKFVTISASEHGNLCSDLAGLVSAMEEKIQTFNFDLLLLSVRALTCWPQAVRSNSLLLRVPDKLEWNIRKLYNILSVECNRRMWTRQCDSNSYIPITYSNIGNVLDLCEAWITIDRINSFTVNSFPTIAVNKIGNATANSQSKFRRFDKDTLVRFMRLVGLSNVGEDFHSYYCTLKFLDHLPSMTDDDICTMCRAFVKKKFAGCSSHPVQIQLRKSLIKRLMELDHISSETLTFVAFFIIPVQSINILEDCLSLQKYILEDYLPRRELSASALIWLASACSRLLMLDQLTSLDLPNSPTLMHVSQSSIAAAGTGPATSAWPRPASGASSFAVLEGTTPGTELRSVYLPLIDYLVHHLSEESDGNLLELNMKSIRELAFVISYHRDTPAGRHLLIRLRDAMLKNKYENFDSKQMPFFLLCLACLGLYNQDSCDRMFRSRSLTYEEKGARYMDRASRHRRSTDSTLGGIILSLQGMLEVEFPEYSGARLTGALEETLMTWCNDLLPDLSSSTHNDVHRFYRSLTSLVGEDRVLETYVLPYTGCVTYVLLVDQHGVPQPVPEHLRNQPLYKTKAVDPVLGTWLMLYLTNPGRDQLMQVRLGSSRVAARLARRQGFTAAALIKYMMAPMDETKLRDYIAGILKQHCSNIQLN